MNLAIESRQILDDNHLYSAPRHSVKNNRLFRGSLCAVLHWEMRVPETMTASTDYGCIHISLLALNCWIMPSLMSATASKWILISNELLALIDHEISGSDPDVWDFQLAKRKQATNYQKTIKENVTKAQWPFYPFQNWKMNKKLSFPKEARLRLDSNLILKWSRAQQKPCGCWLRCYSVWRVFDHGFMRRDCYVTPARGWTGRSVLVTLWKQANIK